ncbi:DUF3052 domain-containing protein [Terracoccus luteus]|uniref:DUF3052 family protein n=1 Tax=Terracoccus luteus TaxID=53356 RepID=A0A495XU50_9MICO|nr:DUF3052 domain-containing protein [Terracoccus luteus]MBB2985024.1 hypothetical protein [Terracoccus luteus]MCP2170676.1 hypothetical protein [Terracoccus luteus]RKT77717.1 DUF3052 family protein [Terracoccus luteus]
MGETAGAGPLAKLGFATGQTIQEFGYDDDVDDDLRFDIEDAVGSELVDEDFNEGADGVLIWYRDGDDDLVDLLVDGVTKLFDQGFVVLCTPKAGRPDHVQASDVEEAASTAGLQTGGAVNVAADWTATRLMPPKGPRR